MRKPLRQAGLMCLKSVVDTVLILILILIEYLDRVENSRLNAKFRREFFVITALI